MAKLPITDFIFIVGYFPSNLIISEVAAAKEKCGLPLSLPQASLKAFPPFSAISFLLTVQYVYQQESVTSGAKVEILKAIFKGISWLGST
ncbi:hypothetical protein ACJJI5_04525 [Microbulbifer sp. EKSA008]|uniref:hypothetical protein n=1 Tax=Microbulbifer sp. EKSA008 TaxID=3243367 RepID=UPI004043108E